MKKYIVALVVFCCLNAVTDQQIVCAFQNKLNDIDLAYSLLALRLKLPRFSATTIDENLARRLVRSYREVDTENSPIVQDDLLQKAMNNILRSDKIINGCYNNKFNI